MQNRPQRVPAGQPRKLSALLERKARTAQQMRVAEHASAMQVAG